MNPGEMVLPRTSKTFAPAGALPSRADALDAVVFDDDVGVLQHFVALHGDDGRAAQHDAALGRFARNFQVNGDFLDVFFLFLEFLRLLFSFFSSFLSSFLASAGVFFLIFVLGVFGVAVFLSRLRLSFRLSAVRRKSSSMAARK